MIEAYIKERRATLIQAIFEELGDITLQACEIPRKDDLLNASKNNLFIGMHITSLQGMRPSQ